MVRCSRCGWDNPQGIRRCEKCNAPLMFDVFISYSRKDYVDDAGNVLPNNMLSKIRDSFNANGISYWFDEEGIYSGDEFASALTKAIRNARIFLFISSVNSNQSKWTSNEISTALEFKKTIIPFRLDKSPYNDSVMMKIVSIHYIECNDEEKALSNLLRDIKCHLFKNLTIQRFVEIPQNAKRATIILDETFIAKEKNRRKAEEAKRKSEAEAKAKLEAEAKAKFEAEVKAKLEAEARRKAEVEKMRKELEEFRRKESEAKQKAGEDEIRKVKKHTSQKHFKELKLTPVKRNLFGIEYGHDLYGYADESGKIVIPYQWKSAYSFSEGLARIESSQGLWGFIYSNGTIVIPCQWQNAMDFSEGFAAVQASNGKWGFIDRLGNEVMPCIWDLVCPFSEGIAAICRGGLWGFMDDNCKFLSNRSGFAFSWQAVQAFSEGVAAVCTQDRWGYINKEEELVIPTMFKAAGPFTNGNAIVMGADNKILVIDRNG